MKTLRLGIPKGSLEAGTVDLFKRAGWRITYDSRNYFPDIDEDVLADCIATYQKLGCWTPHVEITRPAYEVTLDVYEFEGGLNERYAYEQVCAEPPATD